MCAVFACYGLASDQFCRQKTSKCTEAGVGDSVNHLLNGSKRGAKWFEPL